jgi:hypothetical protein
MEGTRVERADSGHRHHVVRVDVPPHVGIGAVSAGPPMDGCSRNYDDLESIVTNHLRRSRVEIPIDLVRRSADNKYDLCPRPLAGELLFAGSQKFRRSLSIPALEVPLQLGRSKCCFDLAFEILRLLVESLPECWDRLSRKGGSGRHMGNKDHLQASRGTLHDVRGSPQGTLRRFRAVESDDQHHVVISLGINGAHRVPPIG